MTPAGSPISLRCFQLGNLEFCLGLGDCAQLCTVIRAGGRDGTEAQGGTEREDARAGDHGTQGVGPNAR